MNLELDELLMLVGRLDAAPGFDTPRERFRRFLLERVPDVPTAGVLVDACQRSVGEQHHRALQDLIVLLGRFLGFEPNFGAYGSPAAGGQPDARWRSRGLLEVVLDVRSDHTTDTTVEGLVRSLAVLPRAVPAEGSARIGLVVVARHYAARRRLEHALAAERHPSEIRLISVQSLLALASLVSTGRWTHLEVVKLLQSASELDLVIDLLDRQSADARANAPAPESPAPASPHSRETEPASPDPGGPAFWVATVLDGDLAAAELLATVVAHRRVLGICHGGAVQNQAAPGDWVCFFLPGKGIAGHAQLASVVEDGASVVRNAEQYSRVYRLADVELYEEPIVQALRAGRPFAVPAPDVPLAGPCLSPISRSDFVALTRYRQDTTDSGSGAGADDLFSARTSRLHA